MLKAHLHTFAKSAKKGNSVVLLFGVILVMSLAFQSRVYCKQIQSPLIKLDQAAKSGDISRSQRVLAELQYIYDQESFPDEYRLSTGFNAPLKCGFGASSELHQIYNDLSPTEQSLATSYSARPSMETTYFPPGGHFALHYDTTGVEAVLLEDLDSSGIPDFIEKAGLYLDSSWDFYHNTIGYLEPPSDGVIGGDGKYDVYFLKIFSFGGTIFENPGPEPWDDMTSYILMHHTFLGFPANLDPDGDQLGALKVTCAHEYYHAVQLAYDSGDDLWLYESGATAQEDALFSESHDNYQYLPFYWNDLDTSLTVNAGFRKYGAFIWPLYLADVHSDSVMKTFWEYSRYFDGMTSFDSALALLGSSTALAFQEFSTSHFFSGSRFEPGYFIDGANYPGVLINQTLPTIPFVDITANSPPDGLGMNILALPTAGGPSGMLKLDFVGSLNVSWRMNLYLRDTLGGYEIVELTPPSPLQGSSMSFMRYNYTDWDTIFVSPLVVSPFLNNNNFTITASVMPHGDADASGGVNIADVTHLIAYIFSQGPAPVNELLMGDSDCSGRVNIADVTLLIAHIFSGGPGPCQ